MRFIADMGVDVRVADWLRRNGHGTVHLRERGWHRMPDIEIFANAAAESRVILMFDLDFAEIAALAKGERTSVIIFRLHNARALHLMQRLEAILPEAVSALEKGAVVVVEESRCRIRQMPVGET